MDGIKQNEEAGGGGGLLLPADWLWADFAELTCEWTVSANSAAAGLLDWICAWDWMSRVEKKIRRHKLCFLTQQENDADTSAQHCTRGTTTLRTSNCGKSNNVYYLFYSKACG
jgi:hypothetical protein